MFGWMNLSPGGAASSRGAGACANGRVQTWADGAKALMSPFRPLPALNMVAIMKSARRSSASRPCADMSAYLSPPVRKSKGRMRSR